MTEFFQAPMANLLKQYAGRIKPAHTPKFDEHKLEMLELLGACPGMTNYTRVSELMELLPPKIITHVPDRPTGPALLQGLYITCSGFADGMQALFMAFGWLLKDYVDQRAVQDVDWAIRDIIGESTLVRSRRDEIMQAFPETSLPRSLYGIYRKVMPTAPELSDAESRSLWGLLYALSQQPAECADQFLTLLLRECRSTIQPDNLPDWLLPHWEEVQTQPGPEHRAKFAYLVIEVTKSDDGAKFDGKFTIEIPGAIPICSPRFTDRERLALEKELDTFLAVNYPSDRSLLVEFLVPPELVCERWEALPVTVYNKKDKLAIGLLHHVVYRMLGRDRQTYISWRDRWNYFQRLEPDELIVEQNGPAARWMWIGAKIDNLGRFEGSECSDTEFLKSLLKAKDCGFAAFEMLPTETSELCNYLSKAAIAGLPILAGRFPHPGSEQTLKPEITALLKCGHRQLPAGMKDKRVDGMNDNRHWANHLALIWDDPYRVPELARPPR